MAYRKGDILTGKIWSEETSVIYLPHSCDEWVIGGISEAEQMIEDLKIAIEKLR